MAFIAAEVYCAILIANATQRALTVPERNSMLAADAFLVPLVEIFQFLEDVVAVKISAAMVTGETHLVRHILIMGVVGGILCGTVAASIATAICSWPAAIQWILAPYSMHDSYLQCPLVPQGPAAADSARMYWLLQARSLSASGHPVAVLKTGDHSLSGTLAEEVDENLSYVSTTRCHTSF